jgi:LEA14-like dessication related protein
MTPALPPRRLLMLALPAMLAGCAALSGGDPPKVSFAGVESLSGEGMELRFTVKLRVQNPADAPLEIDGLSLNLAVRGMDFASGVSAVKTTVPRFGETVLSVPVTVPATALLRQAWAMTGNREVRRIEFELNGRLGAGPFGGGRFASKGELDWPPGGGSASKP